MNRRINHLSQVFHEMKDRYGLDDPVVVQLKEAIEKFNAVDLLPADSSLPFGERRTARTKPSYWNVKLRHAHNQSLSRHDVLAECKRVEHRVFGS
jgi:hypothetical protein